MYYLTILTYAFIWLGKSNLSRKMLGKVIELLNLSVQPCVGTIELVDNMNTLQFEIKRDLPVR